MANCDQTVRIHRGFGHENMLHWYETTDSETAAHEFGHLIGNRDEYVDAGAGPGRMIDNGSVMGNVRGATRDRHYTRICDIFGRVVQPV